MLRDLKFLGVALVAALGMGAMGSASASAEPFLFKSTSAHTTLNGEGEGTKMTVQGGTVECEEASFNGTMAEEILGGITLTAGYENCTAFGGLAEAEVTMNGCVYVFEPKTKESSNYEVEGLIDCEEGEAIVVTVEIAGVTKCTVHIGAQEELETVTVEQKGSPGQIQASLTMTGIEYSQTAGLGLGACETAENEANGTYESAATVTGYSEEEQVSLSLFVSLGSILMTPGKATYNKVGQNIPFTVKNVGEEELEEIEFATSKVRYKPKGKCPEALAVGADCVEEVECAQKPAGAAQLKVTGQPLAVATSKLRGC